MAQPTWPTVVIPASQIMFEEGMPVEPGIFYYPGMIQPNTTPPDDVRPDVVVEPDR